MSKIHYFQRYSSPENTATNNTLQLLARIYDYSRSLASQLLTELTGEAVDIGIEVNQQQRGQGSVPDGTILQKSFKILIESKKDSPVDETQLLRHSDNFGSEEQKILLLLTKSRIGADEARLREKILSRNPGVTFANATYEGICRAAKPLFREHEYEMSDLVADYEEYCNEEGLFDQSKYLMRIVPCGQSFSINKKYGIYFYPAYKGYAPHRFLGIYKNKSVRAIWEIDSVFDADYDGSSLIKRQLINGRKTSAYDSKIVSIIKDAKTVCGYNIAKGHRFFCGKPHMTDYKKSTPYGIMGARFVNLRDVLGDFGDAKDVAERLKAKKWE